MDKTSVRIPEEPGKELAPVDAATSDGAPPEPATGLETGATFETDAGRRLLLAARKLLPTPESRSWLRHAVMDSAWADESRSDASGLPSIGDQVDQDIECALERARLQGVARRKREEWERQDSALSAAATHSRKIASALEEALRLSAAAIRESGYQGESGRPDDSDVRDLAAELKSHSAEVHRLREVSRQGEEACASIQQELHALTPPSPRPATLPKGIDQQRDECALVAAAFNGRAEFLEIAPGSERILWNLEARLSDSDPARWEAALRRLQERLDTRVHSSKASSPGTETSDSAAPALGLTSSQQVGAVDPVTNDASTTPDAGASNPARTTAPPAIEASGSAGTAELTGPVDHHGAAEGSKKQVAPDPNEQSPITAAVAHQNYHVSILTLKRAVKRHQLRDLRPAGHSPNAALLLDECEVARYWQRRLQALAPAKKK